MPTFARQMFKRARNRADKGLESASFELHVSRRALINYENGTSEVPPEVALKMAQAYGDPRLTAKYCSDYCPIGQKYAHRVEQRSIAEAVLGLLKEHQDVKVMRERLIAITADGVIDEAEEPEVRRMVRELLELERAIDTVKLALADLIPVDNLVLEMKKEKAACVAAR